ncbi:MAG: DUF262 domain-containing HNH endonuclease family protein [Deltaproteobacteria bacterium]|nr:DUF262 domain-containing HNH endonuclease family protein [Deltaproteobacteria bacterium]
MDKQTLSILFSGKIFKIPDYQRGYAWEEKQWNDLIEDIDALVTDERVKSHYTGTVVTFSPKDNTAVYNRKPVKVVDVVDGQQRLTTVCLYVAAIIKALVANGESDYAQDIPEFLYHDTTCRLTLNNSTDELFYQLIKDGKPRNEVATPHQKRLVAASEKFSGYIEKQLNDKNRGVEHIKQLFAAITGSLVFTYYTIEEECEIGMTFELMNSRGKGLSVLELLKNYLMHWISRNGTDEERKPLTDIVNSAWRDTYSNIGKSTGNDEQCLRVAWILYCHHLPKNWKGYDGFKSKQYIPLREFSVKRRDEVKDFLISFTNGLAEISKHYSVIVSPAQNNTMNNRELEWLSKIHNTGNIANFLPLMVAARIHCEDKKIDEDLYINLLESLECFAFRVFLIEGKRSNAGKSSFYRWGKELFKDEYSAADIVSFVHSLIRYYSPENEFVEKLNKPSSWYSRRHSLKYTLFEYEKHLLDSESKGQKPRITWADLSRDSTVEHILPQTPKDDSHWLKVWSVEDINRYLHDIGNLVLTRDNSSYLNFEFIRKKGDVGTGVGYSNSDIRQERKIAAFPEWDKIAIETRRTELVNWIICRWKTVEVVPASDVDEDADEEIINE